MDERTQAGCVRGVRWVGRSAVVDVHGDVDLATSGGLQQALIGVMDAKPGLVVVNLADVPYMDSSGVASLVKLLGRARRQQVMVRLAALSDRVRSIFEITRLDGIFEIHTTVEEALA